VRGDNHIFVRLNLNHSSTPQEYMLDTGSPVTLVSPETAAQVDLAPETRVGKFEVAFTSITVGEVEFADIGVMIGDVYTADPTNPLSCELKHGLIGQNLFRHAIWQFDYQQKIVTVTSDLSNLAYVDRSHQVDLIETSQLVLGPHHFIEVLLGEVEMLGMIDTGRPTVEIGQAEFEAGGNTLPDRSEGRYIETTLNKLQVGDLSLIDFPVTVVRAGDLTLPRGYRTPGFIWGIVFCPTLS
jgi:hypothetical protein